MKLVSLYSVLLPFVSGKMPFIYNLDHLFRFIQTDVWIRGEELIFDKVSIVTPPLNGAHIYIECLFFAKHPAAVL